MSSTEVLRDVLVWWTHLTGVAVSETIQWIGQSVGSLIFAFLLVAVPVMITFWRRGWSHARKDVIAAGKTGLITAAIAAVIVFPPFLLKAAHDAYKTKAEAVLGIPKQIEAAEAKGKNAAEEAALAPLAQCKDEVSTLKAQPAKQKLVPAPPEPRRCWFYKVGSSPNPRIVGSVGAETAAIFCNMTTIAPYTVSAGFKRPILGATFSLAGVGASLHGGGGHSADRTVWSDRVEAPNLPAYSVIFVQMDSADIEATTMGMKIEGQ